MPFCLCTQISVLVFHLHSLLSVGDVWPGPCVFPDFIQSSARSWWANLVKGFISYGVDGIWNDMNEPAVFKVKNELVGSKSFMFFFLTFFCYRL